LNGGVNGVVEVVGGKRGTRIIKAGESLSLKKKNSAPQILQDHPAINQRSAITNRRDSVGFHGVVWGGVCGGGGGGGGVCVVCGCGLGCKMGGGECGVGAQTRAKGKRTTRAQGDANFGTKKPLIIDLENLAKTLVSGIPRGHEGRSEKNRRGCETIKIGGE